MFKGKDPSAASSHISSIGVSGLGEKSSSEFAWVANFAVRLRAGLVSTAFGLAGQEKSPAHEVHWGLSCGLDVETELRDVSDYQRLEFGIRV